MMRRVLSLWLPHLPLDRRIRLADPRTDGPFAIIKEEKNAWRIACLNAEAYHAGLREGFSLADARAICPDLLTEPADPVRENALLRALWRWADRLSPRVALDPPDGLLLDIAGCAHLFGGEEAMGGHARQLLEDMHITARIGIADTKGAARALARHGPRPISIAQPGKSNDALSSLPISALEIDHNIAVELARTGLKTIGQLYAIKSGELARRFGLGLTKALGCSLGHDPDPVTPSPAEPVYGARMTLPEPIGFKSDIEGVLERLARSVCGKLERNQKGAQRFTLTVRCVDTGDHDLVVGFARPCFNTGLLLQQFSHPLDKLKIEYGADWFRLAADHVYPAHPCQATFDRDTQKAENIDKLVSTLGNRIGFDHVRRFSDCNSHIPEREFTAVEIIDKPSAQAWPHAPRKRPLRLYKPPERLKALTPGRPPQQFEWRRQSYRTKSARGPERLSAQWWREDNQPVRDYWRVQTEEGPQLWLLVYPGMSTIDWFVAGRFS